MTTIDLNSSGRIIDLSPDLSASYKTFFASVFDGGSLDPKTRAATALAAAIALNNQDVVRSFIAAAKQAGLSNEDLGHIAAVVDVVHVESHQRALETQQQQQPKASKSCC
jgi:alkylhydroperoxidase/carboxymuconolactone decarboxylase family protein YurZ